ncbi:hypothetical protein KQX54_019690 [Cotesia glomerata]|uniref:Uncharacterized protein n=1 Tax=Cotesia glomerata TaxID=32391 RepID=A0AAV7IX98_COTGL|nr:hypothetical protein KQX54_019690 [Cotesia glomerata]
MSDSITGSGDPRNLRLSPQEHPLLLIYREIRSTCYLNNLFEKGGLQIKPGDVDRGTFKWNKFGVSMILDYNGGFAQDRVLQMVLQFCTSHRFQMELVDTGAILQLENLSENYSSVEANGWIEDRIERNNWTFDPRAALQHRQLEHISRRHKETLRWYLYRSSEASRESETVAMTMTIVLDGMACKKAPTKIFHECRSEDEIGRPSGSHHRIYFAATTCHSYSLCRHFDRRSELFRELIDGLSSVSLSGSGLSREERYFSSVADSAKAAYTRGTQSHPSFLTPFPASQC